MSVPEPGSTTDDPLPNGILAETGRPLPPPDPASILRVAAELHAGGVDHALQNRADQIQAFSLRGNTFSGLQPFGVHIEVDPEDLSQVGWGAVFAHDADDAIKEALAPLLEMRREQAGELFRVFEKADGVQPGETATQWLARQGKGPGLDLIDPSLGVPYYLLIVGSSSVIPMNFQYVLDIYWAVGRLHFETLTQYECYAQSVVEYEKAQRPPQRSRSAAVFAAQHSFDAATTMFTRDVARPFLEGADGKKPLGASQHFAVKGVLGDDATKSRLADLLRGGDRGSAPALLFSGTHGMAFGLDDARQAACQGALVCNDWEGFGKITEEHWFGAADLPPDARMAGMIHFLFACYGGGWEMYDTFRDDQGRARQIARSPGVSRLPQAMLAHPTGGALAVVAHVDRAWSYSFKTPQGGTQTTGIREVLTCLMMGQRVGNATDRFNIRWTALSAPLADALRGFEAGLIADKQLARLWIARDDARNYTILGDPAVYLRIKDMPDGV